MLSIFQERGIKKKEVVRLVKIGAEELHSPLGFSDVIRTSQHAGTRVELVDTLGTHPRGGPPPVEVDLIFVPSTGLLRHKWP